MGIYFAKSAKPEVFYFLLMFGVIFSIIPYVLTVEQMIFDIAVGAEWR
jgi:hypothetical protein